VTASREYLYINLKSMGQPGCQARLDVKTFIGKG
jgi:hypothetical protein